MLPAIKVIDMQTGKVIDNLNTLTGTALGSLLWECQALTDELMDAEDKASD